MDGEKVVCVIQFESLDDESEQSIPQYDRYRDSIDNL
jgi:hypothetical protein